MGRDIWQKLRELTIERVRDAALAKEEKKTQTAIEATEAKWKRTKIRRGWLASKGEYKTDWIREILASKPHRNSKNFKIKENLSREVNQYMLDILDCLTTDAMKYAEAVALVRSGLYGLKKETVKAHVKSRVVELERVPMLAELNVSSDPSTSAADPSAKNPPVKNPSILRRINSERAARGLRPIRPGVIWNSITGLEREGFVRKVGGRRGMRGRLRMIGSFYVRHDLKITVDRGTETERELDYSKTSKAYFWGSGQPDVRDRLARLSPGRGRSKIKVLSTPK